LECVCALFLETEVVLAKDYCVVFMWVRANLAAMFLFIMHHKESAQNELVAAIETIEKEQREAKTHE
jgi:hypothetical protein